MHSTRTMHILLGTDGSSHAVAAADRGLRLFAPADLVTLLAVAPTPSAAMAGLESGFAGGTASEDEVETAVTKVEAEMRAALAVTVAALERVPRSIAIHELLETGEPGALLCKLAGELNVDVIVVGSRGRGAVKRALLGSVSSYVAHHAPCPVLIVPSET